MRCGCFPYLIGKALIIITSPAINIILLKMLFNSIFNRNNAPNTTKAKKKNSQKERGQAVGGVCEKGSELASIL